MLLLFPLIVSLSIAAARSVVEIEDEDPELTNPKALPSFSWLSEKSPDGIPLLNIHFPDNKPDDVVSLKRTNPIPPGKHENPSDIDDCIYSGFLKTESTVYAVITGGCAPSDTFDIQFRSNRLKYFMFSVKNGKVRAFVNPFVKKNGNARSEGVQVPVEVRMRDEMEAGPIDRQRALQSAYTIKIVMNYDASWNKKFGGDSVNALRRVLAQAQVWFYHPSLTTKVTLEAYLGKAYSQTWIADSASLNAVRAFSTTTANSHAFMVYRNNQAGTIGLGYVGTVCSNSNYRALVAEWTDNDVVAGHTLAHELGHNMGMDHDFGASQNILRFDSFGKQCTGVGGVMDYRKPVRQWSTCSVQDLRNYRNRNCPN